MYLQIDGDSRFALPFLSHRLDHRRRFQDKFADFSCAISTAMENGSSNGGVSKLVSQLLKKFVPDIDPDERKQIALRRYCMRILGSAIGATGARSRDAVALNEGIKRRLIRARPPS